MPASPGVLAGDLVQATDTLGRGRALSSSRNPPVFPSAARFLPIRMPTYSTLARRIKPASDPTTAPAMTPPLGPPPALGSLVVVVDSGGDVVVVLSVSEVSDVDVVVVASRIVTTRVTSVMLKRTSSKRREGNIPLYNRVTEVCSPSRAEKQSNSDAVLPLEDEVSPSTDKLETTSMIMGVAELLHKMLAYCVLMEDAGIIQYQYQVASPSATVEPEPSIVV